MARTGLGRYGPRIEGLDQSAAELEDEARRLEERRRRRLLVGPNQSRHSRRGGGRGRGRPPRSGGTRRSLPGDIIPASGRLAASASTTVVADGFGRQTSNAASEETHEFVIQGNIGRGSQQRTPETPPLEADSISPSRYQPPSSQINALTAQLADMRVITRDQELPSSNMNALSAQLAEMHVVASNPPPEQNVPPQAHYQSIHINSPAGPSRDIELRSPDNSWIEEQNMHDPQLEMRFRRNNGERPALVRQSITRQFFTPVGIVRNETFDGLPRANTQGHSYTLRFARGAQQQLPGIEDVLSQAAQGNFNQNSIQLPAVQSRGIFTGGNHARTEEEVEEEVSLQRRRRRNQD